MIESILYVVLLLWGLITTIYGLYLSRRNNEKYNSAIVSHLSDIKALLKQLIEENNGGIEDEEETY